MKPSSSAVVAASWGLVLGIATTAMAGGSLGCGSRCAEVAAARDALAVRKGAPERGADVRVVLPFARVDALFAESLLAQPLEVPLTPPALDLGFMKLAVPSVLVARAKSVQLRPAAPGKLRFAVVLEIADGAEGAGELASLATEVEIEPELQRQDGGAELSMRFGLENLAKVQPVLSDDAAEKLGRAVLRWAPSAVRDKLPKAIVSHAAGKLAEYLSGNGYQLLRETLLPRLGELTKLRLKLPAVPFERVDVRSSDSTTAPAALLVELRTDLPVRRGLPPLDEVTEPSDDIRVTLSPSASAELANWALDHGHLPPWYSRDLRPAESGEFRPRFDYVAEDAGHPFKVYSFQERGGCSYFRVGVAAQILVEERGGHPTLLFTALDRALEAVSANPVVEVAAWTKYFLFGAVDQAKRMAASTQLSIGDRRFESRVVAASLSAETLGFSLALTSRTSRRPE